MDGRKMITVTFVFLSLFVIILLQILSIIQSDKLFISINKLVASLPAYNPDTDITGNAGEQNTENEGDWLVWALRVEPVTLNPISAEADIYTKWITMPYIFEPLLTYDYDDMQLKPHLAERYEVSSDALEITFHLKTDVHFSDGVPLTAKDIIFTYETIINPEVDAANLAHRYSNVSRAIEAGDFEVKFILKKPYFKAVEDLSFAGTTGILPEHIYKFRNGEEFNRRISEPVGTGPYVFESWNAGRNISLRRNENYWAPQDALRQEKPALKRIFFRFISDPVASIQALRSNQVDIVIPEPEQYALLANDTKFCEDFYCLSYWTPWTPFYYIGWNQSESVGQFFSDKRVRTALAGLIDRKKMVTHLLGGHGRMITGPFYIFGPENDPNIEPLPYEPEKSKQLLDQAGWRDTDGDGWRDKNGVPFRFEFMYANSYRLYEQMARILQDEAAKIGVELIPEPCEWSILQDRLRHGRFHAYIAGWACDLMQDPYPLLHSSQIGNNGANYVGFSNPEADKIIEQAIRTIDNSSRHKLYLQLHRIIHEEQPYTFLFTRPTVRFVDRRFKNVIVHKLGLNYLQWYVPEDIQRYQ